MREGRLMQHRTLHAPLAPSNARRGKCTKEHRHVKITSHGIRAKGGGFGRVAADLRCPPDAFSDFEL